MPTKSAALHRGTATGNEQLPLFWAALLGLVFAGAPPDERCFVRESMRGAGAIDLQVLPPGQAH